MAERCSRRNSPCQSSIHATHPDFPPQLVLSFRRSVVRILTCLPRLPPEYYVCTFSYPYQRGWINPHVQRKGVPVRRPDPIVQCPNAHTQQERLCNYATACGDVLWLQFHNTIILQGLLERSRCKFEIQNSYTAVLTAACSQQNTTRINTTPVCHRTTCGFMCSTLFPKG